MESLHCFLELQKQYRCIICNNHLSHSPCIYQQITTDLKVLFIKPVSSRPPMVEFQYNGDINRYWAKVIAMQLPMNDFRLSFGSGKFYQLSPDEVKELSQWATYCLQILDVNKQP